MQVCMKYLKNFEVKNRIRAKVRIDFKKKTKSGFGGKIKFYIVELLLKPYLAESAAKQAAKPCGRF